MGTSVTDFSKICSMVSETNLTRNKSIISKAMQYRQYIVTRICCYTWGS